MSDAPSKQPTLKVVPTLVIGLGGTGSLALQYAKQKIRQQLRNRTPNRKLPRKIPFVEFLSLDTTAQEEFVEELTGDEHLPMGHINVPQIVGSIDRRPAFQRSLKWFPRHLNPGQIDSGARGVRHIGRLCFFVKKPFVDARLREKIRSITDYAVVEKELRENFVGVSVEPQSTVDVHIISSLCGGTGSACLLDVAYTVRHIIFELLKQSTNSVSHLVTIDPFIGDRSIGEASREYMRYNFAVALAEIERFMTFDVKLAEADGHGSGWEVEYLDGSTVSSVEKPFSLSYLLGYKDNETLGKENVCELIGESICLTTAHPEGALLKGRLDNVKAHVINQFDPATRKIRAYSSYNAHVLSAEFSEQTAEMAVVLAARAITQSLCRSRDIGEAGIKLDEKVAELQADRDPNPRNLGLTFAARKVEEFLDQIEGKLNFIKENFASKSIRGGGAAETGRRWLVFRKKGREIDARVKMLSDRFNEFKKVRRAECEKLENVVETWLADVLSEVKLAMRKYLAADGMNLGEVEKVLDRFTHEAGKIEAVISGRLATLNYDGKPDTGWYEAALKSADYTAVAAERLRGETMLPTLNRMGTQFRLFRKQIDELKDYCRSAQTCLLEAERRLEELPTRPDSFTESSIWSRNLLVSEIGALQKMLVRSFVERLEAAAAASARLRGDSLAFLLYLDPTANDRNLRVYGMLREVGKEVVDSTFGKRDLPLNMESDVLTFDIGKLVEHAAPAWQVERAGAEIAEVSLTNCPRNTKLGEIIEDLGRSISFSGNVTDNKRIFIFRSEHGSTAERLLGFRDCLGPVQRKLKLDRKSHINDLCLDPEWKIEDPTVAQKVEHFCALFSLGYMFGLIWSNGSEIYFRNGSSDFKLAESETASKNVQRSASFASFIQHVASSRQPSVQKLAARIDDEWKRRKRDGTAEFKAKVEEYLKELEVERAECEKEQQGVETEEEAREVEQYGKEIEALTTQVLRPLERLLKDKGGDGHGRGPEPQGGAEDK